jgi:hypothetical protein
MNTIPTRSLSFMTIRWVRDPLVAIRQTYNLGSEDGRDRYCVSVKPLSITANITESDFFHVCHDHNFHPSITGALDSAYCQYCCYKWTNKITGQWTKDNNKYMKNNQNSVKNCLKCNVYLSWSCMNTWHGHTDSVMNSLVNGWFIATWWLISL